MTLFKSNFDAKEYSKQGRYIAERTPSSAAIKYISRTRDTRLFPSHLRGLSLVILLAINYAVLSLSAFQAPPTFYLILHRGIRPEYILRDDPGRDPRARCISPKISMRMPRQLTYLPLGSTPDVERSCSCRNFNYTHAFSSTWT